MSYKNLSNSNPLDLKLGENCNCFIKIKNSRKNDDGVWYMRVTDAEGNRQMSIMSTITFNGTEIVHYVVYITVKTMCLLGKNVVVKTTNAE